MRGLILTLAALVGLWPLQTGSTTQPPIDPLHGKVAFLAGDSICYFHYSAFIGPILRNGGVMSTVLGASGTGGPIAGTDCVSGRPPDGLFNGVNGASNGPITSTVLAGVDIIFLEMGTNEDSTVGLGSVTDAAATGFGSGYSLSAQLKHDFDTLYSMKPSIKIVLIGPYQSNRFNTLISGATDTQDHLTYQECANFPSCVTGYIAPNATSIAILGNINALEKAVANSYAIPYIDLYDNSGINLTTASLYLGDGLHINTAGEAIVQSILTGEIKRTGLF